MLPTSQLEVQHEVLPAATVRHSNRKPVYTPPFSVVTPSSGKIPLFTLKNRYPSRSKRNESKIRKQHLWWGDCNYHPMHWHPMMQDQLPFPGRKTS